jgi:5'-3' exonuclease
MGVDGLYKFINKNLNDTFKLVSISEIKGKSCIIDGMQHIYSQLIYMRSREKEVLTKDGKNISHIHGLINSLTYYLKNGIIPIFIFDGKSPEIKKNKINERRKNLRENLNKLKELETLKNNMIEEFSDNDVDMIYGTPPSDLFNLEDELKKYNNIQEEYKKIYKKSIILKDYFISDWIEILEYLGLPVIKADGEADPICAYISKNNYNIYGIISDDSDMLIFGAPVLMRKSINQQFIIIELKNLINNINILLYNIFGENINFVFDNLLEFSLLLGTDYGNFRLNCNKIDSLEILKFYVINNMDFKKVITEDQYELFYKIKDYYLNNNYNEFDDYLDKPIWKKPDLLNLKQRLLQLNVDEDYIDKNNEYFDLCFTKKDKYKRNKTRSYSFDRYIKKENNDNFNKEFYCKKFDQINSIIENNYKYNNRDEEKSNDSEEIFKLED